MASIDIVSLRVTDEQATSMVVVSGNPRRRENVATMPLGSARAPSKAVSFTFSWPNTWKAFEACRLNWVLGGSASAPPSTFRS